MIILSRIKEWLSNLDGRKVIHYSEDCRNCTVSNYMIAQDYEDVRAYNWEVRARNKDGDDEIHEYHPDVVELVVTCDEDEGCLTVNEVLNIIQNMEEGDSAK